MTTTVLVIGQSNAAITFAPGAEGAVAFEELIESQTDQDVVILNAAVGGTPLLPFRDRYWLDFRGIDSPYQDALELADGQQIDLIIWIGNEGDARHEAQAKWIARGMQWLVEHLRDNLGEEVPVLIQPLLNGMPGAEKVNLGLELFDSRDPNVYSVQPLGVTFEDSLHFDVPGQEIVGVAMAQAALELLF